MKSLWKFSLICLFLLFSNGNVSAENKVDIFSTLNNEETVIYNNQYSFYIYGKDLTDFVVEPVFAEGDATYSIEVTSAKMKNSIPIEYYFSKVKDFDFAMYNKYTHNQLPEDIMVKYGEELKELRKKYRGDKNYIDVNMEKLYMVKISTSNGVLHLKSVNVIDHSDDDSVTKLDANVIFNSNVTTNPNLEEFSVNKPIVLPNINNERVEIFSFRCKGDSRLTDFVYEGANINKTSVYRNNSLSDINLKDGISCNSKDVYSIVSVYNISGEQYSANNSFVSLKYHVDGTQYAFESNGNLGRPIYLKSVESISDYKRYFDFEYTNFNNNVYKALLDEYTCLDIDQNHLKDYKYDK